MWVPDTWAPMFHPGDVLLLWTTWSWHRTLERKKWVSFHIWSWKSKITRMGHSKFHSLTKEHKCPKSTKSWGFYSAQAVKISFKVPEQLDLGGFTWKHCIPSVPSLIITLRFLLFSLIFDPSFFPFYDSLPCCLTLPLSPVNARGQDNCTLIPAMRYKYVLPLNKQHQMTKETSISITARAGTCHCATG